MKLDNKLTNKAEGIKKSSWKKYSTYKNPGLGRKGRHRKGIMSPRLMILPLHHPPHFILVSLDSRTQNPHSSHPTLLLNSPKSKIHFWSTFMADGPELGS